MIAAHSGNTSDALRRTATSGPEPLLILLRDGLDGSVPPEGNRLLRWQFSTSALQGDPTVVPVPLRLLASGSGGSGSGGSSQREIWMSQTPVEMTVAGGMGVVATPDHVIIHTQRAVGPDADIAATTLSAYTELVGRARELRYPNLVRVWNFIPDINRGSGDDEIYALFNQGRAAAFDRLALQPGQYPAATAVGSPPGTPFTVVVLASRSEPLAIENPRQVSAYQYPRQYGVRAPAFARATILPDRSGGTLFISGTASIVGHESQHRDIVAQLQEALANLAQLMDGVRTRLPGSAIGPHGIWRVYLRDPADLERVAAEVTRHLGDSVLFLQADICRRELQVEVEGVCGLTTARRSPGG